MTTRFEMTIEDIAVPGGLAETRAAKGRISISVAN